MSREKIIPLLFTDNNMYIIESAFNIDLSNYKTKTKGASINEIFL